MTKKKLNIAFKGMIVERYDSRTSITKLRTKYEISKTTINNRKRLYHGSQLLVLHKLK